MDEAALRAHPLAAPFSWSVTGKRNVVATWAGAGEGRSLVLNGHVDVVPPGGEGLWSADPFSARRDGDWLLGRGAGDMKAGLAAIVGAVRGLRRLGLAPVGNLLLQSVVEEECGGNGALQCLLVGHQADACVIPEPFPDCVSISQVGVLWFHVDVEGIPAHVGEASVGVNAIEAVIPIVKALRLLEADLNESPPPPYDELEHPINLNIGVVRGGDWPSTVAAECTLSCRLALFPGQEVAWLQARVEDAIATAAETHPYLSAHPPRVRYDGFAGRGVELGDGRAARAGRRRRPRSGHRIVAASGWRRPPPRTPVRSSRWGSLRCAADRWLRESTEWTSACTSPRWSRLHRCWRSSCGTGVE